MIWYYYYLPFADEKTEARRISNLPKIIQLVCSRDRLSDRVTNCQVCSEYLSFSSKFCILGKPSP